MRACCIRSALLHLVVLLLVASETHAQAPAGSLLAPFEWRTIGPANMVGRITDIEAVVSRPSVVYIATASGGIFKSENGGTTRARIFESYTTSHMGDIAIFQPNPDIVWVAAQGHLWGQTGERGTYMTTDGGRTWTRLANGLPDYGRTGAAAGTCRVVLTVGGVTREGTVTVREDPELAGIGGRP